VDSNLFPLPRRERQGFAMTKPPVRPLRFHDLQKIPIDSGPITVILALTRVLVYTIIPLSVVESNGVSLSSCPSIQSFDNVTLLWSYDSLEPP